MSKMELNKETDKSLSESRGVIRQAMDIAFGSYVEQEAKKYDQWRTQTWWQLVRHLRHEVDELDRSKTRTAQLHNAIDACSLGAILISKILLEERENEGLP